MFLGVIADDFTGATDVAAMLVRAGMRTVQAVGVPAGPPGGIDADAVVVALKSRTAPVGHAVSESVAALDWLRGAGCQRFYFKYCSTFDSTSQGNIGPVAEALLQRLGADLAIACPAFPENRRTVYRGHLFVGDALLSESGMRNHPLTPMTDSNLVRVLQAQSARKVGLVAQNVVAAGALSVRRRLDELRRHKVRLAVVDAICDRDLITIAEACADMPLVTAGSGVAIGLPDVYAVRGWLRLDATAELDRVGGMAAVVSGSCSATTAGQVAEWMNQGLPALRLDPGNLVSGRIDVGNVLEWARRRLPDGPVLIHTVASPDEIHQTQQELGAEHAGALVEQALALVAEGLVSAGVRRLVVAGGETSGAVVQKLGVARLRIGPMIDPGVPWTQVEGQPLLLALKSGNFGTPDFFIKALAMAPEL